LHLFRHLSFGCVEAGRDAEAWNPRPLRGLGGKRLGRLRWALKRLEPMLGAPCAACTSGVGRGGCTTTNGEAIQKHITTPTYSPSLASPDRLDLSKHGGVSYGREVLGREGWRSRLFFGSSLPSLPHLTDLSSQTRRGLVWSEEAGTVVELLNRSAPLLP
jgi:hypothetical protein